MRIIPSGLMAISLVPLLVQASEPAATPEVQTIGQGVIWSKSDVTDGRGSGLPPWKEIVVANIYGFATSPRIGEKVTVIALNPGIPKLDLRVVRTKEQKNECDETAPSWWSIELEPIMSSTIFSAVAPKHRRADRPFDVAIIYPAVPRADLIAIKRLKRDMLPEGVLVSTVKGAIDLTGKGDPDVLVIEYCCGNSEKPLIECDYVCSKTFKRIGRNWRLVDSSGPC